VNIAARLCSLSKGSDLCVSGEVHRSIRNQPGIEALSLGEQQLKNVPEPVVVYRVGRPGTVTAEPLHAAPAASLIRRVLAAGALLSLLAVGWWGWNQTVLTPGPIRSIAVLPLENLSGDPEQEYFADGMTEALIGDLGKIGSLRVTSITSVMRYKDALKPIPQMAKELNVEGSIEGSVTREGNRVRITAQLIDARNDSHLWSDRYDRDLRNVLALQSEIASAVAREVEAELTPHEQSRLHASAVDPAAHDAYLRGLQHTSAFTPADARLAIGYYEKAVSLDPAFTPAYVGLALSYHTLGFGLFTERDPAAQSKASAAARQAVELDPDLGAAQTMLGLVRLYDWDWAGAREALRRAVQLSPSDPLVLFSYGEFLAFLGEHPESLRYTKRAVDVAPLDPWYRTQYGSMLRLARKYDRAAAVLNEVIEMQPDYSAAWWNLLLIYSYQQTRDHEKAYEAALSYFIHVGADWFEKALRRGYREDGFVGAMRGWRDAMIEMSSSEPVSGMVVVGLAVLTGDTELAFTWLDRAVRDRDPFLRYVAPEPLFDPIRSDPRYHELLRRINYPGAS
jgi:TolB-like protein